jgi:membrane protein
MARMADIPVVMRSVGIVQFAQRVWHEIHDDDLAAWAAAMAYSWLFAVFPFLIFLMSLMPLLPSHTKDRVQEEIHEVLFSYLPDTAAETLWNNVGQVLERPHASLLSIGLVISIWSASGGIHMTISALDKCYELEKGRPYYKQRPLAMMLTVVISILVLLLLVLLPIGTIVIRWLEHSGGRYVSIPALWTWRVLRYPIALAVMFAIVDVLYYWGPNIKQRFKLLTPGALFCVTVWIILGLLFRLYVNRFGSYNKTYGTVGGVAVLLLFFYIDALVLLIGVEINSEIDYEVTGMPRGSRDFRKSVAAQSDTESSLSPLI